jgi:hypothetical protein
LIYYPAAVLEPPDIPTGLDVDQTDNLNTWAETIPDGPGQLADIYGNPIPNLRGVTVINLTGRNYRADGTLTLLGHQDTAIIGLNITRLAGTGPQLVVDHCTHLTLDLADITGTKPQGARYNAAHENETAFRLLGSTRTTITRPQTRNIWGDHIYLGKTNRHWRKTSDTTITDGIFGESGRDPIAATAANNTTITNCVFSNGRTCIDLEPNGTAGGVNGITVTDCTFNGTYQLMFLASVSSSTVGIVENVHIEHNHVPNGHLQTMISGGERRANITILDNEGTVSVGRPSGAVLNFNQCSGNITVTGNRNPINHGRTPPMRIARFTNSDTATITYQDNWPDDDT